MPAEALRRRATPADLRVADRLRLFAAVSAGNLAAFGSRLKFSNTSTSGRP